MPYCQGILQDPSIEAQIGNEALGLSILVAKLSQLSKFGRPEPTVLLTPRVERLGRDPELTAQLLGRNAGLNQLDRANDLLIADSFFLITSS